MTCEFCCTPAVCPDTVRKLITAGVRLPDRLSTTKTSDTPPESQNQRRLVKSAVENLFLLKPAGMLDRAVELGCLSIGEIPQAAAACDADETQASGLTNEDYS
jgi:hypothetical protein